MFSFVTLGTNNLKKSKIFYDTLLKSINIINVEESDRYIGYSKKENLTKGLSIVYTSGSSGLFKSGIPVGKINGDSLTTKKTVKFFSDFSQLEFVTIVKFKKADNQWVFYKIEIF